MIEKLNFESMNLNEQIPVVTKCITQEDIWRFAATTLDANVVHINPEWCQATKLFGGTTVVHGNMTTALMMTVISRWAYPLGGKIKMFEVKLFKPVPPNSTLTFGGIVTEKHPIGEGRNFVVIELYAKNEKEETVAIGKAEVKLP